VNPNGGSAHVETIISYPELDARYSCCTAEWPAWRNDVGTLEGRHRNRRAVDICFWWRNCLQHEKVWSWLDFQAAEFLVKWPTAPRSAFITVVHSGGSRSYPWRNSQG